jgi:hypothetical protein
MIGTKYGLKEVIDANHSVPGKGEQTSAPVLGDVIFKTASLFAWTPIRNYQDP